MHIITCTTATQRFEWELEVLLTNLKSFEYNKIIILFCGGDRNIVRKIENKYNVRCHFYMDNRPLKRYPTSNRPYSWACFLKEFPEMEKESFFYIDTDIILREKINFEKLLITENKWIGSDCSSYLQPSYIKQFNPIYYESMLKIIGLSREVADGFEGNSPGAQWLICQPKYVFWEKVYNDSESLFLMFNKLEFLNSQGKGEKEKQNKIQSWCADMWAFLWNTAYFGIDVEVEKQLSFCWSNSDKEEWYEHSILHNAGVMDSTTGLFFKGDWNDESPIGKELQVDSTKCSSYYVEAINKVEHSG